MGRFQGRQVADRTDIVRWHYPVKMNCGQIHYWMINTISYNDEDDGDALQRKYRRDIDVQQHNTTTITTAETMTATYFNDSIGGSDDVY